jgi:hypothetical protein
MFRALNLYYASFIARTDRLSKNDRWVFAISGIVLLYVLFVAFPSFDLLTKDFAASWNILFRQAEHPLSPPAYAPESHEAKLAFRLLIPLVVHVFHLKIPGVLILQFIAGFLSWMVFARVAEKMTGDRITAAILTLAIACIGFSKATFDIRGVFFDNIAFFFLLLPFLYTRSLFIFCCITLAAWIDERALISSSFIFLFLLFNREQKNGFFRILAVLLAWSGYFGLRYYLANTYHLNTPAAGTGVSVLLGQINNWLLGIITGLEGFWLLPLLFIYYKSKESNWAHAILFSGNILLVILVALSVADISRSMNYLFLAVPLMLHYITQKMPATELRKIATLILLLSFLFPAYSFSSVHEAYWAYPMPLQLFRIFFLTP